MKYHIPAGITDDLLERVLVFCEIIHGGRLSQFRQDVISDLVKQHGMEAGALLIGSWMIHYEQLLGVEDGPSEEHYREHANELLEAGESHEALTEMREFRREQATYLGHVANKCQWCHRYRHGSTWTHEKHPPEDWTVLIDTCPDHEWIGCVDDPNPEKELTHEDVQAWIA